MPRFTDDDRDAIIDATFALANMRRVEPERSITMDAMTVQAGIEREKEPCSCGKPRSTLLVPANSLVYKPAKGDEKPIEQTMSVTICMACDGGVEWRAAS